MSLRSVRVFVSSTFRDLQDERDIMTREVFPAIRLFCENRDVRFFEVDLRWGITVEEAAEGRVLELCLAEIDRCRPYFIGVLGDRYGLIDDSAAAVLTRCAPHLLPYADRSVTELEVRHGVLDAPAQAERARALFYFKDLDGSSNEVSLSVRKLSNLRAAVRDSGHSVRTYSSLGALRDQMKEDLERVLAEDLPPAESEGERQIRINTVFAHRMRSGYVRRPRIERVLERELSRPGSSRIVVLGEAGSGKSALLANWWLDHDPINHSVGAVRGSLGAKLLWQIGLRRWQGGGPILVDFSEAHRTVGSEAVLLRLIKKLQGLALPSEPVKPERWQAAQTFQRLLAVASKNKPITIVIDGIDNEGAKVSAAELDWITDVRSANAQTIFSTSHRELADELVSRGWRIVELTGLDTGERIALTAAYLQRFGRKLDAAQLALITSPIACSNPLYLTTLVEELRQFGVFERLDERISHYRNARGPDELFALVLDRLEQALASPGNLISNLLSVLAVSRSGLGERELLALLGLTSRQWAELRPALTGLIGEREGLFCIEHGSLVRVAKARYAAAGAAEVAARKRVIDAVSTLGWTPRALDEVPWQLVMCGHWGGLAGCMGSLEFVTALNQRSPAEARIYATDLERCTGWQARTAWAGAVPAATSEQLAALLDIVSDLGSYDFAGKIVQQLDAKIRRAGRERPLIEFLLRRAALSQATDSPRQALVALDEALDLAERSGIADLDWAIAVAQANAFNELADYKRALESCDRGERSERAEALPQKAALLGVKARALRGLGRTSEARRCLQDQIKLARQVGEPVALAVALGNLGVIERQSQHHVRALKLHDEEEQIWRLLGAKAALQYTLGNRALAFIDAMDGDSAHRLLDEKERLAIEIGDSAGLVIAQAYRVLVFLADGETRAAAKQLASAEAAVAGRGLDAAAREVAEVRRALLARLQKQA
jgi:tetratricopeptide (TPR) repeat protein